MVKKRSKIEEDLFADTTREEEQEPMSDLEQQAPEAQRDSKARGPKRKTPPERLRKRASYDLSVELKESIAQRATELGISASQLAHFLLLNAWKRLEKGELDPTPYLTPSDSPAYRHKLEVDSLYEE